MFILVRVTKGSFNANAKIFSKRFQLLSILLNVIKMLANLSNIIQVFQVQCVRLIEKQKMENKYISIIEINYQVRACSVNNASCCVLWCVI